MSKIIVLTEQQIIIAIQKTWVNTTDYMLAKFFPAMEKYIGEELFPIGLVTATLLAIDDIFSENWQKNLVYKVLPLFFENLKLGEAGEEVIAFFNEAINRQN